MTTMTTTTDPKLIAATLIKLRILWAALLMGQVMMLVVSILITTLAHNNPGAANTATATATATASAQPSSSIHPLVLASGFSLLMALPLGHFMRMQTYKAGWVSDAVTPEAYFRGHLIMLFATELPIVLSMVAILVTGSLWPSLAIMLLTLGCSVVNFPTGSPMMPAANPYSPGSKL
jgi:hypothetical protein